MLSSLTTNHAVPPLEVLEGFSLPLPGEIVTTNVSCCANEGAWRSTQGGGWAIEKASCRKDDDLVGGRVRRGGSHGGPETQRS